MLSTSGWRASISIDKAARHARAGTLCLRFIKKPQQATINFRADAYGEGAPR
jgi:hypothetical protein